MIYVLDFRMSPVSGAVASGHLERSGAPGVELGTEDDLRREPRLTFLLHGFNVNRANGRAALTRFAQQLPSVTGGVVAVLWPGDSLLGPLSYSFEGNDADDTAAELARYIDRVVTPGTELSLVAHSLGCRVAMETVRRLNSGRYPVRQVCLLAAAIDDYSLALAESYRAAVAGSDRVAVLASKRDQVLRLAYPIGDLLQSFFFFLKDTAGLALGYHGPKPRREQLVPGNVIHVQIPDSRGSNHSHYFPEDDPLGDDAQREENRASAARFADAVLNGTPAPKYE
jgi:pimeloyl-ACP methyl ester carboxylesterase